MAKKHPINTADIQGLTRMATDATIGITDLVEAMQKRIVHPPFLPSTPIQHLITGVSKITFGTIKLATRLIGGGLDKALGQLHTVLGGNTASEEKENVLAILNGVIGDYLLSSENPLSIPMQFRFQGEPLSLDADGIKTAYPAVNGKILLLVHGLCMNDLRWNRQEHNHGLALAQELGLTPVYVHYNSGRHISENGQALSLLLEQLLAAWPVPVEQLQLVAHSMGGLVSRSAIHYGQQAKLSWTSHLKKLVCLGTPHHGAPLEQAGNYLDLILEATPYVKPFARLGKIRSAGITDLRYGNLVETDWLGKDRFERQADSRTPIPLPPKVACYSIAASLGKKSSDLSVRLLGDGLVRLDSALGKHDNPKQNLGFKKPSTFIIYEKNHVDLLNDQQVYQKIKTWLTQ